MSDYRDGQGFGRPEQVSPAVYSVKGPDDLDHASGCDFILHRGITPCNCDATRKRFSWWWQCWFRWQEVRCQNSPRPDRLPWPVRGPDEVPWVPGIDFNDGRDDNDI